MPKYNINITGSLTNTNGVLSGFSLTNYATLPQTFNPYSANFWEISLKVKTGATFSGYDTILCKTRGEFFGLRIQRNSADGKLYISFSSNGNTEFSISGTTVLQTNTDYWIKVIYNSNKSTYTLSLSTDGENYTSEGSVTGSALYNDNSNQTYLGSHTIDIDRIWRGTIDLNECYIKINGVYFWRGVTNTTTIQLRRDTVSNWNTVNPTLAEGEVGLETDTGKSKVGDGSTAWNSLAYDLASTALQSHQSLAGYVDLTSAQTITGLKTFNSIKTDKIYDTNNSIILQEYNGNVTVGNNATTLTLRGTDTRPQYKVGSNTTNEIALYSDIPTVPTNISAFTNDSGYITGITSSDVTTALGYTPTDTNLSNLSSTGTKVLDGQWVTVNTQIANNVSVNGSTDLTYTLSDVPNDGNKYEVLLTGQVYTSNTSGNQARIQVSSDIVSTVYICAVVTRASQSAIAFGSAVIPVGNRQITVARDTGWNGAFNLYIRGYRRIGSNS